MLEPVATKCHTERMDIVKVNDFFRRVMAPSKADGPFWVLWIWAFIPLMVGLSLYMGAGGIRIWGVAAGFYFMMFGVTLGFHRYFSHRSYTTNRPFQFVLGLVGTLSGQTGPLSWSLGHDVHHRN